MRSFLILLTVLLVIAAGAVEWAAAAWNEPGPVAASGNQSVVLIEPRTKLHDIAQKAAGRPSVELRPGIRVRSLSAQAE